MRVSEIFSTGHGGGHDCDEDRHHHDKDRHHHEDSDRCDRERRDDWARRYWDHCEH